MKIHNLITTHFAYCTVLGVTLLILSTLSSPETLQAAPQVTAQYSKSEGKEIVVEITVPSPPPSSIIFVQQLPTEVMIQRTQPKANSINQKKGKAKWLLRNLKPGKLSIRMFLDREVDRNEISGEIRFTASNGKGMATQQVK